MFMLFYSQTKIESKINLKIGTNIVSNIAIIYKQRKTFLNAFINIW